MNFAEVVEDNSTFKEKAMVYFGEMSPWRILLCVALATGTVQASPLSDLGSPSPEVRTRAAETIRENHLYDVTPRAPWEEMTSTFKEGYPAQAIIDRLHKKGLLFGFTADELANGTLNIRLDDSWVLKLTMRDSHLIGYGYRIVEEPKEIRVEPPPGYSGFWRTYRIDGKLAGLYDYQNGRNLGNTLHMSP